MNPWCCQPDSCLIRVSIGSVRARRWAAGGGGGGGGGGGFSGQGAASFHLSQGGEQVSGEALKNLSFDTAPARRKAHVSVSWWIWSSSCHDRGNEKGRKEEWESNENKREERERRKPPSGAENGADCRRGDECREKMVGLRLNKGMWGCSCHSTPQATWNI